MARVREEELNLNAAYFIEYNAKNEIERKLIKKAKQLRLC
jgi:hypothetical protein